MLPTVLDLLATHFPCSVSFRRIVLPRKRAPLTYHFAVTRQCCGSTSSIGRIAPRRHATLSCHVVMPRRHATSCRIVLLRRPALSSYCILFPRRCVASSCRVVMLRCASASSCSAVKPHRPAVCSCCVSLSCTFFSSSFCVALASRLAV